MRIIFHAFCILNSVKNIAFYILIEYFILSLDHSHHVLALKPGFFDLEHDQKWIYFG